MKRQLLITFWISFLANVAFAVLLFALWSMGVLENLEKYKVALLILVPIVFVLLFILTFQSLRKVMAYVPHGTSRR